MGSVAVLHASSSSFATLRPDTHDLRRVIVAWHEVSLRAQGSSASGTLILSDAVVDLSGIYSGNTFNVSGSGYTVTATISAGSTSASGTAPGGERDDSPGGPGECTGARPIELDSSFRGQTLPSRSAASCSQAPEQSAPASDRLCRTVLVLMASTNPGNATHGKEYGDRLIRLQTARWKEWLDVQAPFRWNMRRLDPEFTLDLGCGIGRTLLHLPDGGVGVDANPYCVQTARDRGLTAFTPEEFRQSQEYSRPSRFDTLLLAHVAEHMTEDDVVGLLKEYVPVLKPEGRLILISPQEAGFRSDSTHVQFMDFARLSRVAHRLGFQPERTYSFPFPRPIGWLFTYNEFIVVSRRSAVSGDSDGPSD